MEFLMNAPQIKSWSGLALVATAGLALIGGSGCQTTIGGQTLPSAYFLERRRSILPGRAAKISSSRSGVP